MVNLYPFIQGSLESPFSDLFFADVSLWNQRKYIVFNILSCRIFTTLNKILTITEICNEKTNELTIYRILSRYVTIFYRQELASLFQVQEKLKACRNSKLSFLNSCFMATYRNFQRTWNFAYFLDNAHLFKYYPAKMPRNCLNYFSCSNQTCIQVSKFSFAPDK